MGRLAKGDRTAFDPVFDAVRPIVESFAARMVGPTEAPDVAQETLLDLFRSAHEFDPDRDALSWVLGIAAYNCKTARKKAARRREDAQVAEPIAAGASPEDMAVEADLAGALESILGTLRPADRETIAAVLERRSRPAITPAAFRKRVQRALTRLRHAWRERHGVE